MGVEEYLTLLLRRKWLLLTMAVLGGTGGFLSSVLIPAQYTSHTMVLVEEPVVPEGYVKPVVTEDVNQRLASMQGEILSRTRLQDLVEQFNPYKKDTGKVALEVMIGLNCSTRSRSEEHTSELQSQSNLVCRLLLEKKKKYP